MHGSDELLARYLGETPGPDGHAVAAHPVSMLGDALADGSLR
jgi:hypothetical protein